MSEQPDHHADTTDESDDDPTTDNELDDQAGDERDVRPDADTDGAETSATP